MTLEKYTPSPTNPSEMPEDPFGTTRVTDLLYGEELQQPPVNRDRALQELLGVDYEYAHEAGLINDYYYNPDTGEDGLMHILGGENFIDESGVRVPRGFHHEPSGRAVWVYDSKGNEVEKADTYVDRAHLESKNSKQKRDFIELPYSPYQGRVVIDGLKKMTWSKDRKSGETVLVETNNGMFPKEYDALAVMQAVRIARDSRDKSKDKVDLDNRVIVAISQAPMLDGESQMAIKLVLDLDTGKVVSAYPIVSRKPMKLERAEVKRHLGLDS